MIEQHINVWKASADAFDQRYQAVGDKWETASTCSEWNVQQLVDHTVETQATFTAGLVGAEVAADADWPTTYQAISAALEVEGALEGTTNHPAFGEVPKAMMFGIASNDLLIHAWDVARSIGADETLPAEAVSACYMGLQRFPEDARVGSGRFAASIEVDSDADEQSKFIAFSGRQV